MRGGDVRTIAEPSREIPVIDEVDVLVVGGGPAGIAAAVAAARAGARTTLVERYGCLGGLATGGLVLYMDCLFDREGERCIGGIHWESLQRLRAIGGLAEERPTRLHVDSELLKVVADRMCVEAGVVLRLHTWAVEVVVEAGEVRGAIVESKSGRQAILSRVCVDATGDADIAARAGAAYDMHTMAIGLNCKIGGVDLGAYRAFQRACPDRARALREEVRAAGGCPIGAGATPHSDLGVYWVNLLGVAGREGEEPGDEARGAVGVFAGLLNAVDVDDLTYAEVTLREQIVRGLAFYREHVPGYQDARLLAIASQLGVRDSRRVVGAHKLTRAEAEAGVSFTDAVGMTGNTFTPGLHVQVPYRALLPLEVEGLLVGGRCISVDDGLIHTIRLIPPCMMTGEAAGAAAALAVQAGVTPRMLDVAALRAHLRGAGVLLPYGPT